jgi:hypothetical protein
VGFGVSGPPPSSKRIAPPRFLPRSYPKLQDALLLALQPLLFLNDFKGEWNTSYGGLVFIVGSICPFLVLYMVLNSAWGWRLEAGDLVSVAKATDLQHHQHPTSQGIYNIHTCSGFWCWQGQQGYMRGQPDSADQVWSGCLP